MEFNRNLVSGKIAKAYLYWSLNKVVFEDTHSIGCSSDSALRTRTSCLHALGESSLRCVVRHIGQESRLLHQVILSDTTKGALGA